MTIYAVGDIHGHLEKLLEALSRIEADGGPNARIVFLGDYVDRGPDSAGVIDVLARGQAAGREWVFLKGNHDRLFERFIDPDGPFFDPHLMVGQHWFAPALGGIETAASYGVPVPDRIRQTELAANLRAAVPAHHAAFLRGLINSHHEAGVFFAHAGIRPGIPLERQAEQDLLWIRHEFHDDPRDHGALIVHGHTPIETATHHGNRVNLDSGAAFGRHLTAAVFEDGKVWELGAQGRYPLNPTD